jgi:hypothetical protein
MHWQFRYLPEFTIAPKLTDVGLSLRREGPPPTDDPRNARAAEALDRHFRPDGAALEAINAWRALCDKHGSVRQELEAARDEVQREVQRLDIDRRTAVRDITDAKKLAAKLNAIEMARKNAHQRITEYESALALLVPYTDEAREAAEAAIRNIAEQAKKQAVDDLQPDQSALLGKIVAAIGGLLDEALTIDRALYISPTLIDDRVARLLDAETAGAEEEPAAAVETCGGD